MVFVFTPAQIAIYATYGINQLLALVLLVMSVFAFVEAVRASAHAYTFSGRRTKGFWAAVTGASMAYSVFALTAPGFNSLLLQLVVAVAVGVFLADVRPAVSTRR